MTEQRERYEKSLIGAGVALEAIFMELDEMRETDANREGWGNEPFYGETGIATRTVEMVESMRDLFKEYEEARREWLYPNGS